MKEDKEIIPSALMAHAVALATQHTAGYEVRCRRWRRRAAVRRAALMLLLPVIVLTLTHRVSTAAANQSQATGALPTDQAVSQVIQIILNR